MLLFFLRHAHALEGEDDAARPLSPRGKKDTRRIGRFLKRLELEVDTVYTSPLKRARQTAETVAMKCGLKGARRLVETEKLRNETSSIDFVRWLRELPGNRSYLLVGHEPSLSSHIARLLGMTRNGGIDLAKAGLVCLEAKDLQHPALKFYVTPMLIGR